MDKELAGLAIGGGPASMGFVVDSQSEVSWKWVPCLSGLTFWLCRVEKLRNLSLLAMMVRKTVLQRRRRRRRRKRKRKMKELRGRDTIMCIQIDFKTFWARCACCVS